MSNYSVDRPSFAFSTRTTEFDDALLSRNVITLEQAMVAKGASVEEAHRLAQLRRVDQQQNNNKADEGNGEKEEDQREKKLKGEDDDESNSSFDDEDDDDDFIAKYRQQRLHELQQHQQKQNQKQIVRFGTVVSIDRSDWIREVNEDSQITWVVVLLTANTNSTVSSSSSSTSTEADITTRPGRRLRHLTSPLPAIDMALARLAVRFPHIKFVQIPASDANPDWPRHLLPTIFLYRHGQMSHQLTAPQHPLASNMSEAQLEHELSKLNILEEELAYDRTRHVDEDHECDDESE